ncbi:MAG: AAA family ATPase [Eggerthellaceae bacterium]|jgi:pilus assembly protein CpaE
MQRVVLCADGQSLQHPDLLGLEGENLPRQEWLKPISHAEEARRYLHRDSAIEEVWVASSDEMDPINLAAALKRDSGSRPVYLLAHQGNGSLRSRASAAGIDGVIDAKELANRYARRKAAQRRAVTASSDSAGMASEERLGTSRPTASRDRGNEAMQTARLRRIDPEAAGGRPRSASDAAVFRGSGVRQGRARKERRAAGGVSTTAQPKREHVQTADLFGQSGSHPTVSRVDGAYILTVASASGGVGKSTVAVLSALIAQALGYRTLLLDADLQFGDAAQLLSARNPLRIDQALRDPLRLEQLAPQEGRPALLAAPTGVEDSEMVGEQLEALMDRLRRAFDVIIVNTGSFWMEQHIRLLELSSNTLFLVDQRPTSLKAIKRALELCARCGVASTPFLFAVNRCSRNGMLTSLDISCALNGAKVVELKDGGREVEELMGAGMAPELLKTRNDFCQSLQAFLVDILPEASRRERQAARPVQTPRHLMPFRRRRRA